MRTRPGAVLTALVLAALTAGCATGTTAGTPTFGAPKASATPPPTGLAAKPLDEILTAVQKFAVKQKSVHINIHIDGKLFSDADVSYSGAEGLTYIEKKEVRFRTVGEQTYVRRSGKWSEAGSDLGEAIRGQTKFKDIIQEVYSFKNEIKGAEPKSADVIVLSNGDDTEIEVANDEDSPALQAYHITTKSEQDELVLSDWSEQSLQLEAPEVS